MFILFPQTDEGFSLLQIDCLLLGGQQAEHLKQLVFLGAFSRITAVIQKIICGYLKVRCDFFEQFKIRLSGILYIAAQGRRRKI